MKSILILGAGRSSSALIDYIQRQAGMNQWRLVVGDVSPETAQERLSPGGYGTAIRFDIHDTDASAAAIAAADVVVSLLPAHLHALVARHCLSLRKHLLTASYVSDDMAAMSAEAASRDVLFLNECGLDPGIDHMSAMQVIDRIRDRGGVLHSFESFTGGLIARDTDPGNPWRYKFTWNPRNVVVAGQGTAKFLLDGHYRYISYQQLFSRVTPVVVEGIAYEGYANRDSLKYRSAYGLDDIQTMVRGTLRYEGFCSAWNIFVQLGCCDDTYEMENVDALTHSGFIASFLGRHDEPVEQVVTKLFGLSVNSHALTCLRWSGFFSDEPVGLTHGSPARILEHILMKKWALHPEEKDFVVMWHRFGYTLDGVSHILCAHLTATGSNATNTAMARTVGLPLGIATTLLMQGSIKARGVTIPVSREIYEPVLANLAGMGITLQETEQ